MTLRRIMLAVYLVVYIVAVVLIFSVVVVVSPWLGLAAAALYLISHILRALRLAALSVELLGTSARSTVALHFATAPFALLLPFKSGELVRFYALWRMSGTAIYAFVVLLIDRMFDSLFLFPIVVILTLQGGAPPLLAILTLLMATVPLIVIVIGPRLLTEVQHYIVASHNADYAADVLRQVDILRRLVGKAAMVSRKQAPQLSVVSFVIWLCEFLVCAILMIGAAAMLDGTLALLGNRLISSWGTVDIGTLSGIALMITLLAQMLLWPWMAMVFLSRAANEPKRTTLGDRIKGKVIG